MNSCLTLSIAVGQRVVDTTQNALANLAWDQVRLTHPVFEGDTLWSESVVLSNCESASRADAGIVTVKTRSLNQHGNQVLSFVRKFYVYRRDAEQRPQGRFPEAEQPLTAPDAS